jgi:pseudouridine kinase
MGYICVVGGANIDITGKSNSKISLHDSNPGRLTVTVGGVGRNIAENLARLGLNVKMLTVLGTDVYSNMIRNNAMGVGIDLSDSLVIDGANTSTYLCLTDSDGEMYVGLSDMDILDNLTPQFLASKIDIINGADCVVCDTNVPQCLLWLAKNATVPLFVDTVSAKKTRLVAEELGDVFCIKPNIYEAEVLAGMAIETDDDIAKVVEIIHSKGIQWVLLTLAEKGVVASDGSGLKHVPTLAKNVVNTTGAGDSFLAGVVSGYVKGRDIFTSALLGSAASALTIETSDTVSTAMSAEKIAKIVESVK